MMASRSGVKAVPSSAVEVARARRTRIRSIRARHLSRAARNRAREQVARAIALRGGSDECWFVDRTQPAGIEAIAPYTETDEVAISLWVRMP